MRAISITFRCRNLKKMRQFYSRSLGWEVTDEGPTYCYLDTGGITIGLLATDPEAWDAPTGNATFLDVEIDDPVSVRSILAERGVELVREELTDAAIFMHVKDPEGNLISFFKTGTN
ncbi:MAG: VOC family protein [bacterium]|nr:VOC family protein [bacterium]